MEIQRSSRICRTTACLAIAAGLALPSITYAVPIFGVNAAGTMLASFDSDDPTTITSGPSRITGLAAGDVIEGIAFRPANGLLYAVSRTRLYTLDTATSVATAIPGSLFDPLLTGSGIGVQVVNANNYGADFNPVSDELRVVSQTGQNLRINPNTGMIIDGDPGVSGTQPDGSLRYAPTDPNVGTPVIVAAVAYTNDVPGATSTTAYAYNFENDTLLRLGDVDGSPLSPSTGQLFTVGRSRLFTQAAVMSLEIIPSGQALATLRVGVATATRLFSLNLTTGLASSLGLVGDGTIFIGDIAIAPTSTPPVAGAVQFSTPAYSVDEGAGTATVMVTRSGGSAGAISVLVATSDGTAVANADYTAVTTTVNFPDGDSLPKPVTVSITEDAADELDETVILTLSNATGGAALGAPSSAVLTIVDNDDAPLPLPVGRLQFGVAAYSVDEGAGSAIVMITRSGGSAGAVAVDFATGDNSAIAGADYGATTMTVNFADGDTAPKAISIPITDDTLDESDETVNLALSNVTGGASIGAIGSAVLTIRDNDDAAPGPGPGDGDDDSGGGGGCALNLGGAGDPTLPILLGLAVLYLTRRKLNLKPKAISL